MSRPYSVKLTPSFQKDLECLPPKMQERVLESLPRLEENPLGPPPKIKRLKGQGVGQWRLRVGDYRVRYDVVGKDVVLYRVRDRKEVYRT